MNSQKKQKFLAGFLTSWILLAIFLIMNNSRIPKHDLMADQYDNINWTRFRPKPIPIKKAEEIPKEKKPDKRLASADPLESFNLDDLAEARDPDMDIPGRKTPEHGRGSSEQLELDDELSRFEDDPGFLEGIGEDSPLSSTSGRGRKGSAKEAIALTAGTGSGPGIGDGDIDDTGGSGIKGPSKKGKSGGNVQVELKGIEDFGTDFEDFSPILKPLIEWMKLHPAKLSPVEKRFIGYQSGALTSRVTFDIETRTFELLLLCVEATYEVRIVLLEHLEVTYLIDEGFKEKSNYLRVGRIERLENGEIFKFGTNLRPASSRRTEEFYQIFLSWWESVKHEVES